MLSRRALLHSGFALTALAGSSASPGRLYAQSTPGSIDQELWSYLSIIPAQLTLLDQGFPFEYGNIELRAETLGIPWPVEFSEDLNPVLWTLAISETLPSDINISEYEMMDDSFAELTGFVGTQIASAAHIGGSLDGSLFLRGSFDIALIQAAQVAHGYEPIDVNGNTVFSLNGIGSIDPSGGTVDPSSLFFSGWNYSTVLDDGTLVYAAFLEDIELMLAPSVTMATVPDVQRAVGALDRPLASAELYGAGYFVNSLSQDLREPDTNEEIAEAILALRNQEPMPAVQAGIVGVTPGGPVQFKDDEMTESELAAQPTSYSQLALVYASGDEAEQAAPLIDKRLSTTASLAWQRPYTEIFSSWSVEPDAANGTVLVTLTPIAPPSFILTLAFARDLGFVTG